MAFKKLKGGPKMYRKNEDKSSLEMASPAKDMKTGSYKHSFEESNPIEMGKHYGGPKMGKDYGGPNMDYDGLKMHGKHDGPKMKSGFKMKSGSPFQRNFGIGASPVKAAKPDYIDIDGDGNKEEPMKEAAADKKNNEAGGPQMQSPMKRVGEFVDVLDEEGNILSTKRVTEGLGKGKSTYRNVNADTRGDKFYAQAEKNIQKQIDEGKITPEEGELISTDAATYGQEGERKYKKQRRLTGIDLKMEKLRNLRASYEDAGESFEEAKNTPEYKAKLKEINEEYEQYKKDNPDTWEQDLAIYQNRMGEDYDYSEIPKSQKQDGSIVYQPAFDEAMKADLGKGEVATRKFEAETLGKKAPSQFPPGHPLHDKIIIDPETNPEYTYESEGIDGRTFTAGGGGDRRKESDLRSAE